jgi:hypothetical protein
MSVPHTKHITPPLRAQQVNAIYRFVTMVYKYNYHNSGHYPSSCLLFETQLNSVGLSVTHRKHTTSPLRAQQVNAIYRFVTMIRSYNYCNLGHYPFVFYLKLNIGLCRWYISITITILDIIHRPV